MRFFLLLAVTLGIVATILLLHRLPSAPIPLIPSPIPPISLSPVLPPQSMDVNHNGNVYRIAWLSVTDPSALTLIPNFTEKRTARSLIDRKECTEVVNGGFYTKDTQPTGLFVAEGKTIRGSIPNALLNGYVLVDQGDTTTIQASPPDQTARLALQTGPILTRAGAPVILAIRDDEFARRVIVGVTQKGVIIFLAIYDPENPWSGPKLADTPAIVAQVTAHLQIVDALNLDGGSASAFIRGDINLEEITQVGSFFCIK